MNGSLYLIIYYHRKKNMNKLKKLIRYLFTNPIIIARVGWDYLSPFFPDKFFTKVKFRLEMGYWMDFNNPQTYNEKLQWLKFNDIHPEYSKLVDKIEVKQFVADRIGKKHVIPTIATWNTLEEIDWTSLPNQFVIKASNDSGGVVVCKDKSKLKINDVLIKLRKDGDRDYSQINKEYPYRDVPHRYLAEQYMEDESKCEMKDYKFFCFDGKVKFLFVATGRQSGDTRFDFFDTDFAHLPIINGHPNADIMPSRPDNFDEMIKIAEKLSVGMRHVRVDLYNINGSIYFGELTFFHWSGIVPFEPFEWDKKFGEFIKLPINN